MISLYADSPFCTFGLIIYTCVLIPLFQITKPIFRFFTYLCNPHQIPEDENSQESPACQLDLPVFKFQDLACRNRKEAMINHEEEMCSICLMEFENEDLVNKLPRCSHVFHKDCIEKWLDRCQFTCPLCRSMVFQVPSSSSKCSIWASDPFCVLPSSAHDS